MTSNSICSPPFGRSWGWDAATAKRKAITCVRGLSARGLPRLIWNLPGLADGGCQSCSCGEGSREEMTRGFAAKVEAGSICYRRFSLCPEESVGKRSSLCLCEKSLCLCGEITPENIHHRGTEIAQRHGDRFSRQTPKGLRSPAQGCFGYPGDEVEKDSTATRLRKFLLRMAPIVATALRLKPKSGAYPG